MRSVLVTGSSSGIGRACATRLARDGWRVFAGVRSEEDARSVESEPGEIVPVRLDVAEPASIEAALARIEQESGGSLDALVNNAGIGVGGPLECVAPEQLRQILDVNVVGQVAVTQAVLPLLRSRRGRIVFIGSVGDHAAKFALEAVADSLRAELRPQGLAVTIVEPSVISTPIWAKAKEQVEALRGDLDGERRALYWQALERFESRLDSAAESGGDPAEVAAKVVEALDAKTPASRYQVGRGARTLVALRPLLPDAIFDRLARLATG
jgi:NAD(P)-dependent dehydrogenase (short-subunit alcohol dehydrogenase family)